MNKHILLICSLFSLMHFTSCMPEDKEIDIDLSNIDSKLVVYANYTTPKSPPWMKDSVFPSSVEVLVTDSKAALNDEEANISDAQITLTVNGGTEYIPVYDDSIKVYRCGMLLLPGDEVEINVVKEGYKSVQSNTTVPSVVEIDQASITPNVIVKDSYSAKHEAKITFTDPAGEENYYEINVSDYYYSPFDGYSIATNERMISDLPYYPSKYDIEPYYLRSLYVSDSEFDGEQVIFQVFYGRGGVGGRMFDNVHLVSITKEYYEYRTTRLQQRNNKSSHALFYPDLAIDVYSNIENGYGVFSSYQASSKYFVVEGDKVTPTSSPYGY